MRSYDTKQTVPNKYRDRIRMTIGGLICVLTGSIVALVAVFEDPVDIVLVVIGLVVGLIGAGIIHPDMVLNYLRRRNGKDGQ